MLNYIVSHDIIMGYRHKRRDPLYRVALGKTYTFLTFLLFGLPFKDINCGFKLFKREAVESSYKLNGGLFYAEVLLRANMRDMVKLLILTKMSPWKK